MNRIASALVPLALVLAGGDALGQSCPELVGKWERPPGHSGYAKDVAVLGSLAYVAVAPRSAGDPDAGLHVIDVADQSIAMEVGFVPLPGHPVNVAVASDYAVVLSASYFDEPLGGLRVVDVSTPSAPVEVGAYVPSWSPLYYHGLALAGSYAYVGADYQGLRIVDVSVPAAPTEVGFYDPSTYVWISNLVADGDYAYLTGLVGYHAFLPMMEVVQVSDPSAPVWVGGFPYVVTGAIAVGDGYAYVADDTMFVLDVSDITDPTPVGSCSAPYSYDIALCRSYAFISGSYGLRVVDVRDPTNPVQVGFARTGGPGGVAIVGDLVYVAEGEAGMGIYDACTRVFHDGFELGNTSAWSLAVP